MKVHWTIWAWRLIGASMMLSGALNLFGLGEDLPALFTAMAAANQDTRLAAVSGLIAANPQPVILLVALFMMATGLCELAGRFTGLAALGQAVMMLGFITLLHRAFPEVILTDGLYLLGFAVLFLQPRARKAAA